MTPADTFPSKEQMTSAVAHLAAEISAGHVRSLIFLVVAPGGALTTYALRCFLAGRDRLPMAQILARNVAGLIGGDTIAEESVKL